MYFETPIIVSSHTFLAEKTNRLGIGYDIDTMDDNAIVSLINRVSEKELRRMTDNAYKINKKDLINNNMTLFEKLDSNLIMQ